jgi:hypothetical protein
LNILKLFIVNHLSVFRNLEAYYLKLFTKHISIVKIFSIPLLKELTLRTKSKDIGD